MKRVREMSSQLIVTLYKLSINPSEHKQLRRHLLSPFREFPFIRRKWIFAATNLSITKWNVILKNVTIYNINLYFHYLSMFVDFFFYVQCHIHLCTEQLIYMRYIISVRADISAVRYTKLSGIVPDVPTHRPSALPISTTRFSAV